MDRRSDCYSKNKKTVTWRYVINHLNREGITRRFDEKELQKTSQSEFTIKRVMRKNSDKLLFKWKGDDNFLIVGMNQYFLLHHKKWYKICI